ncbi:unnamed protein product [Closterium sp. Naga37s-1]|nr:unnamed protein product [Closterium sp. Naga37s-1]
MTQRQEDATWHNQHSDAPEFEEQNGALGNGSGRRREQEASETSHELSYHTGVAADRVERGVGLRKGQGCGGGRGDVAREGRASEWGRERGVSVGEAREKGVSVRVESGRGVSGRRDDEEEEEKEHVVEVVGEEKDEEEEEEDEADVIEVSDTDGESEEQGKEEGEEEGGEGGGGEGGEEEEVYGSVEEADVDCPICGCHLSHLEPIRREQHSNACLDAWGRDKGEEEETETCRMGADTGAWVRDRGEEETERGRMDGGGRVKGTAYGKREERGGREEEEGEHFNACLDAWGRDRGEEETEICRMGTDGKVRGLLHVTGDLRRVKRGRVEEETEISGVRGDGAVGAQKRLITDFFGGGNRHRPPQQQQLPQQQQAPGATASLNEVSRGHQQGAGRGVKWGGRFAGRGRSGSAGRGGVSNGRGGGWNGGRGRGGVSLAEAWEMIPGTDFLVDAFKRISPSCHHWFLTHFHADHYNGLTKSFRFGTVYCSAVTARLVKLRLGLPEEKICELPVGERVEIAGVGVTLMDANHCTGAVMILFEPSNGQAVLHTGDFRWHPSMAALPCCLNACPPPLLPIALRSLIPFQAVLHTGDFRWHPSMAALPCLTATRIHTLILDTTYCHPKYDFPPQEVALQFVVGDIQADAFNCYEFPPQEVALQFVVEAIQAEAFNTNALFLIGTYTIGKEKVFLEAAKALKRKVYVGAVKRRLLACLGLSNDDMAWVAGDGEEASTNLHAVPLWSISSFKRIEHIAKFHRVSSE